MEPEFKPIGSICRKASFVDLSAPSQPTRSRVTRGLRTPAAAAAPTHTEDEEEQYYDAADWPMDWPGEGRWPSPEEEAPGSQEEEAPGAVAGVGLRFSQRGAAVSDPLAPVRAAERQLRWDEQRQEMQRSYVQQLPQVTALREEERQQLKAALEGGLAAQPAVCYQCGGTDMLPLAAAEVLYISVDHCFLLAVPRCACQRPSCGGSFAPSPFAAGCFPATPKVSWDVAQSSAGQPARWFDLRLLQLADGLRFQTRRMAVHSFATVVHQQLVQNGCGHLLGWEHFKRQLGEALTEYGYLKCALMVLANIGVQGLPSGPLSDCPCCSAASESTPLPGINVDFCFALCHLARCGTAALQVPPPNQRFFLNHHPDLGGLLKTGASVSATVHAEPEATCSDFDAARVLGRTDEKFDVTAVGATVCRHYLVANLLDIGTGERYIYACIMLYMLMVNFGIPILVVWYDINCKFGGYFMRWAVQFVRLVELLRVLKTRFPLPVFHKYCHKASCLERNDGLFIEGTGRQFVEAAEPIWSWLGPLGIITQFMTHRNRWGVLERATQLLNMRNASRIVPLLCSMAAKWEREREEAAMATSDILWTLLQSHGITAEQAMERLAERIATMQPQHRPPGPSPDAEYGLLRMRLAFAASADTPGLPPAVCLFPGGNPSPLLPGKPARRTADVRMGRLEAELFEGQQPSLHGSQFAAAAAAAAGHEIQRLQAAITSIAQQVQLTDLLITKLSGRPADQEKARRAKQALQRKVAAELPVLQCWLAGGYVGFNLLPVEQRQHAESAAGRVEQWTAESICRGTYPWEDGGCGGGTAGLTAEELLTRLRINTCRVARCEEELAVVQAERERCMAFFSQQQQAIQAAIARIEERQAALEEGVEAPPCSSAFSRQPASMAAAAEEQAYCAGLLLLLRERLCTTMSHIEAARVTFGNRVVMAPPPDADEYELDEESAAM